ncbi:MAG: hypothetical protein AMXMBFR36_15180 [Acidobacteriota bacterium]
MGAPISEVAQRVPEILGVNAEAIAKAMADVIEAAHTANPEGWDLTLERSGKFLRLNAGPLLAAEVTRDWTTLRFVVLGKDAKRLPKKLPVSDSFKVIPSIAQFELQAEDVEELWPAVRELVIEATQVASRSRKRVKWPLAHSQPAVEAIAKLAGRALPAPVYLDELADEGPEGLERAYLQFLAEFGSGEKGRRHAEITRRSRVEAARIFEEIRRLEAAGEDLTGAVLLGLLPHVDSKPNRSRGAWVSVAPAVNKDIRTWFEGSGLHQSHEWPEIARALWALVKSVAEDPSKLGAAIDEFQATGLSKGFQAGMVTPILNALRPAELAIFNSKSRKVLNLFAETAFGPDLASYPEANSKLFEWTRERAALFQIPEYPDLRPSECFDMFAHWYVAERRPSGANSEGESPDVPPNRRIVKVAPGRNAEHWEDWRNHAYASIGWPELGNLTGLTRSQFVDRRDAAVKALGKTPGNTKAGLDQVWRFVSLAPGDLVVANRGTTEVLGVGEVTGSYQYAEGVEYCHRIPVRWQETTPRAVRKGGWRKTVVELAEEDLVEILGAEWEKSADTSDDSVAEPAGLAPAVRQPEVSLEEISRSTQIEIAVLRSWTGAIERKGQAILYGPPGTGKTFVARKLAQHLVGGGSGFYDLLQFHASYAYEDFIQGLRPVAGGDGAVRFEIIEGRFLEFCRRAAKTTDCCVLIVDEINRANLSRVFGELMYLLEYRGDEVALAGGRSLRIPHNVRLIGTMNTADRSIALVDHALRRRFAFLPLRPEYEVLRRHFRGSSFSPDRLIAILERVNAEIGDANYSIGISYFIVREPSREVESIWRMEIEPYLEELFFDQPQKLSKYRWEKVVEEIFGT